MTHVIPHPSRVHSPTPRISSAYIVPEGHFDWKNLRDTRASPQPELYVIHLKMKFVHNLGSAVIKVGVFAPISMATSGEILTPTLLLLSLTHRYPGYGIETSTF